MPNDIEIEARFLNLDRDAVESRLRKLGAQKKSESFFREWIFTRDDWRPIHARIRIRDNGENVWLTYKENPAWEVDSTREIEMQVSSAEAAAKILEKSGVPLVRYQEKKRIHYALGDLIFELDFWPKIPMVLEIEAPSKEKVQHGAELLGLNWEDAVFVDQLWVHHDYYGIDLREIKEYRF